MRAAAAMSAVASNQRRLVYIESTYEPAPSVYVGFISARPSGATRPQIRHRPRRFITITNWNLRIKSHKLMGSLWAHTGFIGCITKPENVAGMFVGYVTNWRFLYTYYRIEHPAEFFDGPSNQERPILLPWKQLSNHLHVVVQWAHDIMDSLYSHLL